MPQSTIRVVNITPNSSSDRLKQRLSSEADKRGLNFRYFIGDIYEYAVKNPAKFQGPLRDPPKKGGEHIGALVSDSVASTLKKLAKDRRTSRGDLCRYILEKALEDKLIPKVLGEAREQ